MIPWFLIAASALPASGTVAAPVAAIRAVGPEGKGAAQAAAAWQELSRQGPDVLPELLAAMDDASPVARSWLCSAVGVIADRADSKAMPTPELEAFVHDTRHNPRARRLAYEMVLKADPGAADRYLPAMLDDPSLELRRDAVVRVIAEGEKLKAAGKKAEAIERLRQAFAASRDKDQVDQSAKLLRELGDKPDVLAHLGMVLNWKVIGPFPNKDQKGVDTVYPPEKGIDLAAEYDGKAGKVKWKDYTTNDPKGTVDLRAAITKDEEVVAYCLAEFTSPEERDAEIRMGCWTTLKLWVNGEQVLDRRDALTGSPLDSYIARVHFKKGKNLILLKSCLDVVPPPIPKGWKFLFRICDQTGGGLLSAKG